MLKEMREDSIIKLMLDHLKKAKIIPKFKPPYRAWEINPKYLFSEEICSDGLVRSDCCAT